MPVEISVADVQVVPSLIFALEISGIFCAIVFIWIVTHNDRI